MEDNPYSELTLEEIEDILSNCPTRAVVQDIVRSLISCRVCDGVIGDVCWRCS